jgi:hypothetical protein
MIQGGMTIHLNGFGTVNTYRMKNGQNIVQPLFKPLASSNSGNASTVFPAPGIGRPVALPILRDAPAALGLLRMRSKFCALTISNSQASSASGFVRQRMHLSLFLGKPGGAERRKTHLGNPHRARQAWRRLSAQAAYAAAIVGEQPRDAHARRRSTQISLRKLRSLIAYGDF